MNRFLRRRRASSPQEAEPTRLARSSDRVQVSPVYSSSASENHYETMVCLKYGRLYGVISLEAYESGKADLLARL